MTIKLLQKIKAHKAILLRSMGVALLAWACYIPEVKIDLNTAYVKSGILSQPSNSRGYSTTLLNDNLICTGVFMLGCIESAITHSWEFREMLKKQNTCRGCICA